MIRATAIAAFLALLYIGVSSADYNDAKRAGAQYCKDVRAGVYPNYDNRDCDK